VTVSEQTIIKWGSTAETKTLPSGKLVQVRKPDIVRLVMEGGEDVPTPLRNQVIESMNANGKRKAAGWQPSAEDLALLSRFMDRVVRAAVVQPRIVPHGESANYEAGEIEIADIDSNDRMWLFSYAMPEEYAAAQSFRK
jgi:hypothetical protein